MPASKAEADEGGGLSGPLKSGQCFFLRRLGIRRAENQHDLPQGHVVAGANAKVDDGPFRDEEVAGRLLDDHAGRGIGQHAKLPGFIAAALDAVDVDQMERVAGRFLHDHSSGVRQADPGKQAWSPPDASGDGLPTWNVRPSRVDLQRKDAAVVEPQLARRLEPFGGLARKLHARAGQDRPGRRCLALFRRANSCSRAE